MNDLQKPSSVATDDTNKVTPDDSSSLPVRTDKVDEFDVDMWWVKNVKEGDAKQAEATMKALVSAGLKPRLVAHALEKGHGYSIESLVTRQSFTNLNGNIGELASTEKAVAAYEIVDKPLLGPGEHLEQMIEEEGLVKAEVVTDIENVRGQIPSFAEASMGKGEWQKIEMTVVVKREPPKQISDNAKSSYSEFVRIEDLKTSE